MWPLLWPVKIFLGTESPGFRSDLGAHSVILNPDLLPDFLPDSLWYAASIMAANMDIVGKKQPDNKTDFLPDIDWTSPILVDSGSGAVALGHLSAFLYFFLRCEIA